MKVIDYLHVTPKLNEYSESNGVHIYMEIRIGTSGYSFKDWRNHFYPTDIVDGKMLDYYIRYFSTVEINSTYYRIPHPAVMVNIVKKTPAHFDFMIKVPQSFTHRRTDMDKELNTYLNAIEPVERTGQLAGLLAQFPYSFKHTPDNLDYVTILKQSLAPRPLFVEFRHASWVNRTMYDRFCTVDIGYVCVDEPKIPGLLNPDLFATTKTGYIRLHGRNKEKWWDGGDLRYDYSYSTDELEEWKQKIEKIKKKRKLDKLYIYFNNCHAGQAAANALTFQQMLT